MRSRGGDVRHLARLRERAGRVVALGRDGDPTREAIEARRPMLARARVRRFVRPVVFSTLWLATAMYGLLMVSLGGAVR